VASPQCENGYTKVANELLQSLYKYVTNPTWLRISLLVIRLTYGYRRKEVMTNVKSFATSLCLTQDYVKNCLIEMGIARLIFIEFKTIQNFKVVLNKNYEEWTFVKR
jgi:phage replication O-like protein O